MNSRITAIILTVLVLAAGVAARDLTFFVWSDTHFGAYDSEDTTRLDIIEQMNQLPGKAYPSNIFPGKDVAKPEFLLHLGDITDNGLPGEWDNPSFPDQRSYMRTIKHLTATTKTYEVLGNHDCEQSNAVRDNVAQKFGGTYYSFEAQGVYFFVLDTYCNPTDWVLDPQQLDWLANELSQLKRNTPVIIALHPPVNVLPDSEDTHERLWSVVKGYNVLVFMHGHRHSVEHTRWEKFDVLSPAGFSFRRVNCEHCQPIFSVIRITDNAITAVSWDWYEKTWLTTPSFRKSFKDGSSHTLGGKRRNKDASVPSNKGQRPAGKHRRDND